MISYRASEVGRGVGRERMEAWRLPLPARAPHSNQCVEIGTPEFILGWSTAGHSHSIVVGPLWLSLPRALRTESISPRGR